MSKHAMCTCSTYPSYVSPKAITNQMLFFYVSLLAQACPTVQCILVAIFCNTILVWPEQHVPLTRAWWVHSNVYGLGNIHCIRYLTAVDPFHSTTSAVQTYHHLISGSVEIPLVNWTRNSNSIGEEPVPYGRPIFTSIRRSAASSLVSYTEQGIITTFTNVLQDHDTVVLVCCTFEWEPDITWTWEGSNMQVTTKIGMEP